MRRRLPDRLWVLCALVCLGNAIGSDYARADLYFEKPAVNAGVVYSGSRLLQRFPFISRGSSSIEITDARASCGCLAPRVSQRFVKAGEAGIVELEVNTLSQPAGPNTWSVRILYSEAGMTKEETLFLRAQLIAEVTVQPAAMVLLAEKAAAHEVTVTDTRANPLAVKEARTSIPGLKPHVSGPERDERGHVRYRIGLEIADDFPDGRRDEILQIYTDDARYPDFRVPITLVKRSRQNLSATPQEVSLTAVSGQPIPARLVLIRDQQNRKVKIERIDADDPAITCRWAEGPNAMATVKIQIDHKKMSGTSLAGTVRVDVREPVPETVIIPVSCKAK
jgi:Protein of unknown function (DUF1573)